MEGMFTRIIVSFVQKSQINVRVRLIQIILRVENGCNQLKHLYYKVTSTLPDNVKCPIKVHVTSTKDLAKTA